MLGSKAFVIWQLEVCDHSQLLQVCHKHTGQISLGQTKRIGLLSRSVPSFSQTVSALTMHTLRDDLLEAIWQRCHVCYYPLESQLLLKHQSRPGMVIQKGFSSACQKHSRIPWTTQMECPSMLEHGLVQSFRQGLAGTYNHGQIHFQLSLSHTFWVLLQPPPPHSMLFGGNKLKAVCKTESGPAYANID